MQISVNKAYTKGSRSIEKPQHGQISRRHDIRRAKQQTCLLRTCSVSLRVPSCHP
jgi:hypothetical protein